MVDKLPKGLKCPHCGEEIKYVKLYFETRSTYCVDQNYEEMSGDDYGDVDEYLDAECSNCSENIVEFLRKEAPNFAHFVDLDYSKRSN